MTPTSGTSTRGTSPLPPVASTVRWVAGLWLTMILVQRFQLPGVPVALLLPIVLAWGAFALRAEIVEVDRPRLSVWLVAAGLTGLGMSVQTLLLTSPVISPTSWALFLVVWSPFVLRLRDRRPTTFLATMHAIVTITLFLAVACLLMLASQLAGLAYRDYLAELVPATLLFTDEFVITYPIAYESPIYRSNAFLGLEPSFVSAQLGLALLIAVLTRRPRWMAVVLLLGMVTTVSGSGFALLTGGVIILLAHPGRVLLVRYAALGAIGAPVALLTPIGQLLLDRVTEADTGRSSTSLRAILPYQELWPTYVDSVPAMLLGRGAGSAQNAVEATGILGLLVPTPIKIFFEYGLVAGTALAFLLVLCFLQGPSRSIAGTLLVSLWTLQPGSTTMLIVLPVLLLVTLWAPTTPGFVLERESRPDRPFSGPERRLSPRAPA